MTDSLHHDRDRLTPALGSRLRKIKAFLLDVDGVLTHGGTHKNIPDVESRTIIIMDAHGITEVQHHGIRVGIITGGQSHLVVERARELAISDIYQDTLNKLEPYEHFKQMHDLHDTEIAYMGDSVLDLPILRRVGFAATPSNASSTVKLASHYVAQRAGGFGAVREVLDLLLRARADMLTM